MIVMKFGGTSVQDAQAIDCVAAIVRDRLPENPVVVVSAVARMTDQLLAMARAAGAGDREKALELSRAARERHFNTASDLLGTGRFVQIHSELEEEFNALDDLLRGIVAVGELTPRTTDNIAGFGERVSSRIATAAFSARGIKTISFEEAAELAYFGAKVLHPATLLPAIQKNIPVLILNSRNPENEGTRITATAPRSRNIFKAIAAKKRITVVDVVATRMLMAHGFLKSIFDVFANHRCPVDMVSTSEVSVSLTVDSNESIAAIAADLAKLADVKYAGRKAIVCLVGENIRNTPGIVARVFSAISDVNIQMISQGASEIN